MMRRAHRLAALLAAATAGFAGPATAAAEPEPVDPQPSIPSAPAPAPAVAQAAPAPDVAAPDVAAPDVAASCAALAEPADGLGTMKEKLLGIAGGAAQSGFDIGTLISLYGQSQDLLRSLHGETDKLRAASEQVAEPDLRDATLSLARTLDEGTGFTEQFTNIGAPKPSGEELTTKATSLSARTASSLQRFGESYQKMCGVDLGLSGLGLPKAPGKAPSKTAPGQPIPTPAPSNEAAPAPAPASNRSLLAPAPIK